MQQVPAPWVVGLTGGIASGKSAASDRFAQLGAGVVDTDVLAREVTALGTEGLGAVVARFGNAVVAADGNLDRRALRHQVFGNADARRDLEAILHPRIRAAAAQAITRSAAPYIVLVVPLLVESAQYHWVNRVLVVDVDAKTQRERLAARDGIDAALVEHMLAAQASREQRLVAADDVVRNSGSRSALEGQVDHCHRRYLRLAALALR